MTWHATDALDTAADATKRLLLPFDIRRWLALALVAFFVSGSTGFNFNANVSGSDTSVPVDRIMWEFQQLSPEFVASGAILLVLVIGLALLVGLVLAYVGAVMEFVFVEIARSADVRVRGFFGDHLGSGLSLLALRLLVGFAILAVSIVIVVLTAVTGGLFLVLLVLATPLLLVLGVAVWLFLQFTGDFVVPVMIAADVGIVEGWRRFWPALVDEWKQYGVYAGVRVLLGIVGGIVVVIGFAIIAVAFAIPFGIVGFGGAYLLIQVLGAETLGAVFAAGMVILYAAAVLVAGTTAIQVPVQTYLRYYSLLVLGRITPEFDLVADVRGNVSGGSVTGSGDGNGGDEGDDDGDEGVVGRP